MLFKTAMSASSSSTDRIVTPAQAGVQTEAGRLDSGFRRNDEVKARCAHFGDCGGCQLQNLEYPAQLAQKVKVVSSFLKLSGWDQPVPIHSSPAIWYYRNKMEFSFQDVYPKPAPGEDYLLLGQKRRNRWDKVLNLSECYLLSPEAPRLLASVHAWALEHGIEPYNLHRKTGFLRHLVVREGKGTGDRMVLLVTSPGDLPQESFAAAVKSSYPATTILWGVNGGVADVARTNGVQVLEGPGHIVEKILGRQFKISPYSFFQTNTGAAADLYARIKRWIQDIGAKNILDLYCGSGGIALSVVDACESVVGVELVPSAVEDARANAAENGIRNAEFIEAKTEDALPGLFGGDTAIDAVIADPPRSGLHPKASETLLGARVPWIIYVSCNPKALGQDVERLAPAYSLERVEAVDLFPHTEHVETLALLKRNKAGVGPAGRN